MDIGFISIVAVNYLIVGSMFMTSFNTDEERRKARIYSNVRSIRIIQRICVILLWPAIVVGMFVAGIYLLMCDMVNEIIK